MDNTNEFVEKIHDTQRKAARNKRRFGHGTPADKLQNKQHGTNK